MKKTILFCVLGCLLALAGSVGAAVINEYSLSAHGFAGVLAEGSNTTACADYLVRADQNWLALGAYPMFSIHADFSPVASPDANLVVVVNADGNGTAITADQFQNGWFRSDLNSLITGDNTIRLCANTSDSTTRIEVSDDSLLGVYQKPVFLRTDFVKRIPSGAPQVGDEFEIAITLHNSGSEKADVNVFYKKPYVPYDAILFVKGQTQFLGQIIPGETISFSYTAKSTRTGMVTVPAAILSYTNIFGETENRVSNYPVILIGEPDISVDATILNKTTQKRVFVSDTVPLEVVIQNTGLSDIYNIAVALDQNAAFYFSPATDKTGFSASGNQAISVLKAGESRTLPFSVTASQEGRFSVGCTITYQDSNTHQTRCQPAHLIVEAAQGSTALLAGFVLVLAAALLYLYYHFRKV
ncbi:MAG: hypothetical protein Q7R47_06745 [Candidatus Diapherotrites archaeon]|nr:hypothetical protein [Candidatus Diapherotrites archaeon]